MHSPGTSDCTFALFAEYFDHLCLGFVAAESEVEFFVTVKADDVGEKTDLRFGPVSVGAVDLPVNVAGIDE